MSVGDPTLYQLAAPYWGSTNIRAARKPGSFSALFTQEYTIVRRVKRGDSLFTQCSVFLCN